MLECDDIPLYVFTRCDRLRPNTSSLRFSGMLSVKSSVDDFDIELGTVRVRVGLSYDPLRLSPCSGDLLANHAHKICVPHPTTPMIQSSDYIPKMG
jgi:hypothetical protein